MKDHPPKALLSESHPSRNWCTNALAVDPQCRRIAAAHNGLSEELREHVVRIWDIATGAELGPGVAEYEPPEALFAGPEGLDDLRRLAPDFPRLLAKGGLAAVEIGAGQQADVESLFVTAGLEIAAVRHDLSGIARAVAAKQPYQ